MRCGGRASVIVVALQLAAILSRPAPADERSASLAELGDLRAALDPASEDEPIAVTFRILWEDPARYEGRRVRVEGRAERRFRQAALGAFPPLSEIWIVDAAGNPTCLVHPTPSSETPLGSRVRFDGVFLRLVRYAGRDGDRLAPLIAGPRAPTVLSAVSVRPAERPSARPEWSFGVLLAAVAFVLLLLQHARRPRRRPGPPSVVPQFLRPEDLAESAHGPSGGGSPHGG
jgi:hypothetical protein